MTSGIEGSAGAVTFSPQDIDAGYAPLPHPEVLSYPFEAQLLLVNGRDRRVHVLSATAALVWENLDGNVTLGELAGALSAEFAAPLDKVEADVLRMAEGLGGLGLLVGIAAPEPVVINRAGGQLAAGDQMARLNLIHPARSEPVAFPRPDGSGTLLVNWSPSCGFCSMVVSDLAACLPGLVDRGIDLILAGNGDPGLNQRLLEPHGLAGYAWYETSSEAALDGPHYPFGPVGTPAAYLLDANGVTLEGIAVGAPAVSRLARKAAGIDVSATEADSGSSKRRLPTAREVCGPAPPGGQAKSRQWVRRLALEVAGVEVGIRVNSEFTGRVLGEAFADLLVAGHESPPANFSVLLAGGHSALASTPLSVLLVAERTAVRSRSPRRVLRALTAHLSALADNETDLLKSLNVAVVFNGRALLLPPAAAHGLKWLQPRLASLGVHLSDEPYALVDPTCGELVIPEPAFRIPPAVLDQLPADRQWRSELHPCRPGRYSLAAWTYEHVGQAPTGTPTPAEAVAGLLGALEGTPDMLHRLLPDLAGVVKMVPAMPVKVESPADALDTVSRLLVES